MNILTDTLPEAVEIDDIEYAINYDFRTCLKVIMAFEDDQLSNFEKQSILLGNMYPVMPDNTEKAIEMAVKFLDGGKNAETEESEEKRRQEGQAVNEQRLFSFSKDANFIFAAFKQTHNIDLEKETDLHWWKFIALFLDLSNETKFNQIISIRHAVRTGQATDSQIKEFRDHPEIFELDQRDPRTPEQIEMDMIFDEALNKDKQQ